MASSDGSLKPESKNPEDAADNELSDLLIQPAEILIKICNYLDPSAFREFAFTCKDFYHFCRNAKGIDIVVFMTRVFLLRNEEARFHGTGPIVYCYDCLCGRLHDNGSFQKYLKSYMNGNSPFTSVNSLSARVGWNQLQLNVKHFFARNGVKKIRILHWAPTPATLEEAKIIADFSKLFAFEEVNFDQDTFHMSDEVMEACLQLPLTKLYTDVMGDLDVDFLRECKIPSLTTNLSITLAGMEDIVQIWKSRKGLKSWTFRIGNDMPEFIDFFNRRYEVLPFHHRGPIDRNRSVVTLAGLYFYIPREDGEVFSVNYTRNVNDEDFVEFRKCLIDEAPLALRRL